MLSRMVAGLLLAFVIYGTTIEAAHRHGRILGTQQSSATSISDKGTSKNIGGNFRSCAECLICQLHQHFSTSLLNTLLRDSPPATLVEIYQPEAQSFETRAVATETSRGPPLA